MDEKAKDTFLKILKMKGLDRALKNTGRVVAYRGQKGSVEKAASRDGKKINAVPKGFV